MPFTLTRRGAVLLAAAPMLPVVTAVRREKVYHANRGTVTATVVERERIALTELRADGERFTFSAQGHSLTAAASDVPGGIQLALEG